MIAIIMMVGGTASSSSSSATATAQPQLCTSYSNSNSKKREEQKGLIKRSFVSSVKYTNHKIQKLYLLHSQAETQSH